LTATPWVPLGLDTLARILGEMRIRGGARLVRGSEPVVSWTARPASGAGAYPKMEPGPCRWTFEPYGIAVRRSVLRAFGLNPLCTGGRAFSMRCGLRAIPVPTQRASAGTWKHEREWRLRGTCRLIGCGCGTLRVRSRRGRKERLLAFPPPTSDPDVRRDGGNGRGQDGAPRRQT